MRALNEVQWPEGMWVCVGSGTGSRSADDRSTLNAFNEGSNRAEQIRVKRCTGGVSTRVFLILFSHYPIIYEE